MKTRGLPVSPIKVGCVGGGQLGRMMALEAPRLGIRMKFLDPAGEKCPAALVVPEGQVIQGSLKDEASIRELAKDVDVLTVEIEHVGVDVLDIDRACCSQIIPNNYGPFMSLPFDIAPFCLRS